MDMLLSQKQKCSYLFPHPLAIPLRLLRGSVGFQVVAVACCVLCDLLSLAPAFCPRTDKQLLRVQGVGWVHGVGQAGPLSDGEVDLVLDVGERQRQSCRGIDLAEQHVRYGVASLFVAVSGEQRTGGQTRRKAQANKVHRSDVSRARRKTAEHGFLKPI
jgi:hypothetical protein